MFQDLLEQIKRIDETSTYTSPFWNYLIHETRNKEVRDKILKEGFEYTTNPNILKGIYTIPDIWYRSLGIGPAIKIFTRRTTRVFDNGAEKPSNSLRGFGNVKFNEFYVDILSRMGYDLPYANRDEDITWLRRNKEEIERFFNNMEDRQTFMRRLRHWLLPKYDVYVDGGQVIIVNKVCIEKLI